MTSPPVRPAVRFLSDSLLDRIVAEARDVLAEVGVEMEQPEVRDLLLSSGCREEPGTGRVLIGAEPLDRALGSAPRSLTLHDRDGNVRADLGGSRVHFTPGSAAINVLDEETGRIRPPLTSDYIRYVRLVEDLPAIDYPSTALIPSDVPERISDAYRLYLSLVHGTGPVVTGAFTVDGYRVMEEMLIAVRGSARALADAPLAIFSCCPTAPLKWSDVTSKNVIDGARRSIPVEFISMPLTGFAAPGTLVGSLVQHTAETLSGLVISQTAKPGAPILWGGSPAIFDYRYETTPVGAVETQILDCAYAEIGKSLGLPTQAYTALSDSKRLDAQAGMESASGAILAALAGINSISGPGMLDFESCFSLEKLVLDNEICAAAKRLARGVEEREGDFPAIPHFRDLLKEGHSLIADHTRRWFRREVAFPGPVIDRANRARFVEEGATSLAQRARDRIAGILKSPPRPIDAERRRRLDEIMIRAARSAGMDRLPGHEI